MVPSAKVFFTEVRTVYTPVAAALGLTGPEESDLVAPSTYYAGPVVGYRITFGYREGTISGSVELHRDAYCLTVDVEQLAMAIGVVEKRGGISFSAKNQKQLRKSLQGHADYAQLVHPFLADLDAAEKLMRQAGAREWSKR
ncbi:hypothetical protein ACIQPR_22275 [Streptomyces sp. NPDC091280]|uniref:hypothetical protein n=1 Tax=Streptomyces sp. NPDC091280 TaxID=3365984 RepID=UPI00382DBD07